MSIQQQAMIDADPTQVYAVLADAEALSALSGMSGVVGRSAGEEFSAFDGHVVGRQIELVPGERIVQTWRFPVWEPGTYSTGSFDDADDAVQETLLAAFHAKASIRTWLYRVAINTCLNLLRTATRRPQMAFTLPTIAPVSRVAACGWPPGQT